MSVTLYDKALLEKIQHWIKDNKLTIIGVDDTKNLFRYNADINNDKPLQLPLIALSRLSPVNILSTAKRPLSFNGARLDSKVVKDINDEIFGKTNQLNAIPIQINYQLDIYTRYEEEVEEYVRNFVFNLINYPRLTFEIPYNSAKIDINSYIKINSDIQDTSDIPERLIPGQFSRRTITFSLSDAYLYDYRTTDNWKIGDISLNTTLDDNLSQFSIQDAK